MSDIATKVRFPATSMIAGLAILATAELAASPPASEPDTLGGSDRASVSLEQLQGEWLKRHFFVLKTPWDNGTIHLLLSPHERIEKFAALVPPPWVRLIRYHGVLASHAAGRTRIVSAPTEPDKPRRLPPGMRRSHARTDPASIHAFEIPILSMSRKRPLHGQLSRNNEL